MVATLRAIRECIENCCLNIRAVVVFSSHGVGLGHFEGYSRAQEMEMSLCGSHSSVLRRALMKWRRLLVITTQFTWSTTLCFESPISPSSEYLKRAGDHSPFLVPEASTLLRRIAELSTRGEGGREECQYLPLGVLRLEDRRR